MPKVTEEGQPKASSPPSISNLSVQSLRKRFEAQQPTKSPNFQQNEWGKGICQKRTECRDRQPDKVIKQSPIESSAGRRRRVHCSPRSTPSLHPPGNNVQWSSFSSSSLPRSVMMNNHNYNNSNNNCLQSVRRTPPMVAATKPKVPPKPTGLNKMLVGNNNGIARGDISKDEGAGGGGGEGTDQKKGKNNRTTEVTDNQMEGEENIHHQIGRGHPPAASSQKPALLKRPNSKPPIPAKNAFGSAQSAGTKCHIIHPPFSAPTVRKPSARPPPPPVDGKMHKTAKNVPKPPPNPPPPPPKLLAFPAEEQTNIYEEIGDEAIDGGNGKAAQTSQKGGKEVPKYQKRTVPGRHSPPGRFRQNLGQERGGRRRTTQLDQFWRLKGEEAKGAEWDGTERRQEDEMPPLTPFGSTSSPFVCCCSVCLHSSPLLSRSLFLPSATTTLLDKTAPSASMSRHRSRMANGDIEHKLGRIGSDLRLNLTKGMDKIRYRMALLNTRHCPSAHFCAFGKRLFPQQANNAKNLATKMKAANSSRTTATIGANKSTFYVTTEEGEEDDEATAGEEDEFADDWSTTSSGSSQDKRQDEADGRCWKDAEDAERSERAFIAPSTTTQCPQQPPSLWEEIESEYQQLVVERRRRRQGQAENCPHQSMDTFCAVDIDTLCPPSRPSTATTPVFANIEHFPQQNPAAVPETCDDSAETGRKQSMKSCCPSSSSSSSSYCCCSSHADSVAYTSRLPIQQPLYQIYMLQEEHPLADVSASPAAAVASDPCSFVVSPIDDIPSVAPLRLETIAEVAGGDNQPKSVAAGTGGAEQRGPGVRGTRNELDKVEETDSACNDPTENGSVGSSCAVNVHRHSSTASSSADSGRADSLSRLSSHPNTPNVSQPPVRRERLLGGSKFGSQRSLWCELPEVKEAGFLDKMDSGEKKLQEAYFEVITSEASYLRSLSFLISHFMCTPEMFGSKSKRSVISSSERKQLFSNIVAIRDCSERLLCELETRLKESLVLSELCDILCEHFERHFSPYVNYCSNQVYQDRTLKALKTSNPHFLACIQRLEADRQCQGLDMRSFLLLPMQRITRYPLLIYAILDRLHPAKLQHSVATRALTLAIQVVRNCNEGARKMERTEQLLEIDSKIVYRGSELRRVPLVSSGRYVVKSGRLLQFVERRAASTLKMRHLMLFLFSDLLLITKGRPNGTFACKDYALRRFVVAEPLEANDARVPPRASGSGCSLHLILCTLVQNAWGNQVELLLNADSESDRERWLAAMRPPSCTNPADEKIYAEWDCPQAVAVHNYAIQQEDELDLVKEDLVNILRKMPDGWFYGERTRDGKTGWFPSSYVQQVMNDHIRANNYRQRLGVLQQRSGDAVFRRGSSLQAMPNGSDSSLSHTQQHEYALLSRLRRLSSPFGVAPRDG
uniref:Rho guanine nucleotide exchange factor 26 n=1 Tax=Globodera rostochiensis TaxID=31243 RepID=A0A914GX48_GLORO